MKFSLESFQQCYTYIKKVVGRGRLHQCEAKFIASKCKKCIYKHFDPLMVLLCDRLHLLDILILTEVNADETSCAHFSLYQAFIPITYAEKVEGNPI